VLAQEKTLPAISETLGEEAEEVMVVEEAERARPGAKGLIGVAVVGLHSTATRSVMYSTVFGEGIGELDAATRRTCGFGDAPEGVVPPCHDSFGAKSGILKAPFVFERGTSFALLSGRLLSVESCDLLDGLDVFAFSMSTPSSTWCMAAPPEPELPLAPELLQRPQIGRRGRP